MVHFEVYFDCLVEQLDKMLKIKSRKRKLCLKKGSVKKQKKKKKFLQFLKPLTLRHREIYVVW